MSGVRPPAKRSRNRSRRLLKAALAGLFCRLGLCLVPVLLFGTGCIARHIRMEQKGLTCGDAHRIAMQAVARMGYSMTEATKPAPGVPGIIVASRQDGTNKRTVMVSVVCTGQGAEVEAKPESAGVADLNFPAEFRRSFAAAAANQAPPRAAAEHGMDVLMMVERDGGREQLGDDLSAVGVLPVRVRLTNHTGRTYQFKMDRVAMVNPAGERVGPLSVDDLRKKLAAEPPPTLRQKMLTAADIEPGQTVTGFLLFPFDSYSRARVELIDSASGEPEGFSIEL